MGDVFRQRLENEYDANVVITAPSVPYKAVLKASKKRNVVENTEHIISTPADYVDPSYVEYYLQPMVLATILTPKVYEHAILRLCDTRNGEQVSNTNFNDERQLIQYKLPLNEIIVDFYDKLKSISAGYASFDYEEADSEAVILEKVDFRLNGTPVDELSFVCPAEKARSMALSYCTKLKTLLPQQMYAIAVQGFIGNRIIARDTVRAAKKDVLAKCYGGDYSRKLKLLQKHKAKQTEMKLAGKINVPKNLFIKLLTDD